MTLTLALCCILIGFSAMLSGGFWGLGGGWLIMPALLLAGVNIETAVVASLLQMIPSTLPTVIRQFPAIGWRKGSWGYAVALPICLFSFAGSLAGKPLGDLMLNLCGSRKLQEALYLFIMAVIFLETVRSSGKPVLQNTADAGNIKLDGRKKWFAAISGIITGVISSLLGIGGGSLVRPVMKSFLKVPEKIAGMILRLSVLIVAVSGSASYLIGRNGSVKDSLWLALFLTIGGLPAFALGARMHSIVTGAGDDKTADSSFALFIFFVFLSVLCKITDYIVTGRIIIVISGILLIAYLASVTLKSKRKLKAAAPQ
ncbi:MAG: sulfite exporter TauE/SafE family protein [Victivallaceae bacterium]